MKKFAFGLVALLLVMAVGCRKDNSAGALPSIPSDTGFFGVINLQKLNENVGNKVEKDGDVKVSTDFSSILKNFGKDGDQIRRLLSDNQGSVDFSMPLTIFEYKGSPVVTFFVSDEDRFQSYMKQEGHTFSQKNGVLESEGTYFVKDGQVWISKGGTTFTAQTVVYLLGLDEKESLAGVDYALELADGSYDIAGWLDIARLTSSQFTGNMGANMALNTVFDGAKYLPFTVKFDKNQANIEAKVLTSKFEPAKYLFKSNGVDMSLVESYQGRGNAFFAFSVDPAQVKQLIDQFGSMAAAGMKPMLDMIGNIDGTIVGSASMDDKGFGAMANFVSSDAAVQAQEVLNGFFPGGGADLSDTKLYFHGGTLEGESISNYASDLKGALWGVVYTGSYMTEHSGGEVDKCVVKATAEGESCIITINIATKKGQNSLMSLLKAFSVLAKR